MGLCLALLASLIAVALASYTIFRHRRKLLRFCARVLGRPIPPDLPNHSDDTISPERFTLLFPSYFYSNEEHQENETCCICAESMMTGEKIKRLGCDHLFHAACITEWTTKYRSSCPLCNAFILSDFQSSKRTDQQLPDPVRAPEPAASSRWSPANTGPHNLE